MVWRRVWPDGEVRWIKGHARMLRDKAGQPIRMIGTNWDISEIKRRERNLACLSHLQQAIASLSSEEEVMRVTSERLADHFDLAIVDLLRWRHRPMYARSCIATTQKGYWLWTTGTVFLTFTMKTHEKRWHPEVLWSSLMLTKIHEGQQARCDMPP